MSTGLRIAHAIRPASGRGQDRALALAVGDAAVLAIADGSGGRSGGAEAADRAIELIREFAARAIPVDPPSWAELVARIDRAAPADSGECALVIAAVSNDLIVGASAGDCGAWLIESAEELTSRQIRKPLIGSRKAVPIGFSARLAADALLLASDGLFNYARAADIAKTAAGGDLDAAAGALTRLPELRSGSVPDDVAVILCRRA